MATPELILAHADERDLTRLGEYRAVGGYRSPARALELAVASVKRKTSIAMGGRSMAYHPMLQHSIAEMALTVTVEPAQSRVAAGSRITATASATDASSAVRIALRLDVGGTTVATGAGLLEHVLNASTAPSPNINRWPNPIRPSARR